MHCGVCATRKKKEFYNEAPSHDTGHERNQKPQTKRLRRMGNFVFLVWWRRAVLPSLPWVVCFLSFKKDGRRTLRHFPRSAHTARTPSLIEKALWERPVASAPRALLYECRPGSYRPGREGALARILEGRSGAASERDQGAHPDTEVFFLK